MIIPELKSSPQTSARLVGLLYLILIVCGSFSMLYVPGVLVAPGDAATTVGNILAAPELLRLGILSDSIIVLTELALVVLLYELFKPVNKTLSLIAALARLGMLVIQSGNLLGYGAVLLLLSGGYLAAFEPAQVQALVLLVFDAHQYGVYIWQIFFGFHCLLLGYLLFKSGYFPRVLGILMAVAGCGYLFESYGNFLYPGYQETYALVVALAAMIGELPFVLWLLFKGLNVQEWEERTGIPTSLRNTDTRKWDYQSTQENPFPALMKFW